MSQIHPQARTTPRVRAEIQASEDSPAELARRYNISEPTAAKWQARDSVEDRSHRPHKLSTTLSPAQEAIVVELRRLLLLPLDDLLVITREFVNAQASRSALDRCLRRHGVNNLRELQAAASGESAQAAPPKRFKDYEPGFVHVDIKYLPQMPDETARRYLYVGIDRATRWVFVRIYADMETTSAVDFVNRLHEAGACQGSCRVSHAATLLISAAAASTAAATPSRSGLSVTAPIGDQSRVLPDQRFGFA